MRKAQGLGSGQSAQISPCVPELGTSDDLMVGGDATAECRGILEWISVMRPDIVSTPPARRRVCLGAGEESDLKGTWQLYSFTSLLPVFNICYRFKILNMTLGRGKAVGCLRWGERWGLWE